MRGEEVLLRKLWYEELPSSPRDCIIFANVLARTGEFVEAEKLLLLIAIDLDIDLIIAAMIGIPPAGPMPLLPAT